MVQHADIDHSAVVASALSFGSNANSVSSVSAAGASSSVSRADHVHVGVRSLTHTSNSFSGPLTIVAQGSIGITKTDASTIAINSVGGTGVGASSDLAGKELDYAQITTAVTVTATAEGSATTVVTGNPVTYDGSTIVMIEFYAPFVQSDTNAAGDNVLLVLIDSVGPTNLGRLSFTQTVVTANRVRHPVHVMRRLTPSAGAHTYSIAAWASANASASVEAGSGGNGNSMPAFIRITRVSS